MLNAKDIEIKNIDHLGIVAGIVEAIGLVEIINELIGEEKGEKVSPGYVVKAMILNGLGFVSKPLYMFPKYFETIACEHLIGAGVKPEYLNDDKLGRVMDKLFIKGLDTIFLIIALKAAQKFGISLFFADSIFLKASERIESLGMIMGLCLLVYTLAQRQIRAALKESKSTIKNQLGKATDRPTLRWIFQCFQSIHLVEFKNEKHVYNWTQDRDFILNFLPYDCLHYYQLVS